MEDKSIAEDRGKDGRVQQQRTREIAAKILCGCFVAG